MAWRDGSRRRRRKSCGEEEQAPAVFTTPNASSTARCTHHPTCTLQPGARRRPQTKALCISGDLLLLAAYGWRLGDCRQIRPRTCRSRLRRGCSWWQGNIRTSYDLPTACACIRRPLSHSLVPRIHASASALATISASFRFSQTFRVRRRCGRQAFVY